MTDIISYYNRLNNAQTEDEQDREFYKNLKKSIRKQFPCKVVSVDHTKQHCDIEILAKEIDNNGQILEFPIIPNVPIRYPNETGSAYVRVPVRVNDTGTIEFFDTDISQYKVDGTVEYHYDEHYHQLTSGLYTSGFYAEQNVFQIDDPENTAIEIGTKTGTFVFNVDNNGNLVCTATTMIFNALTATINATTAAINATTVNVDATITNLGVGGNKIARLGDQVSVTVPEHGICLGSITSSGNNTSI